MKFFIIENNLDVKYHKIIYTTWTIFRWIMV